MKYTKRQKYLLVVFAVALVAFLADRIQLGLSTTPSQAEAAEGMDIGAILPAPGTAFSQENLADKLPGGRWALADRFEEIAKKHGLEITGVRDAFRPAESWVGKAPKKQQEAKPVDPDKARVEKFIKSHQLQGVVIADKSRGAIINGKYLIIGQEMDGFRLVEVNKNSVMMVMVSRGTRAVLTLAEGMVKADG